MKIAVIHGEVPVDAGKDEQDGLVQAAFVSQGLAALGQEPVVIPFSLNLEEAARTLTALSPAGVFNLVETLAGKGSLIHLAPSLLDTLGIPYTGAGTEAMLITSNKISAKKKLASAGLPTPSWFTSSAAKPPFKISGPWLVKSAWEHASVGLDEDSVITEADEEKLRQEMARRGPSLGGQCFAEAFIDGREFNLSVLDGPNGPEVLPPAEIRFDAYPPGKVRMVGYRAKWAEDTFEFNHTPRSFTFAEADGPLLAQLKALALQCWQLFDLRGYARIDFRIDRQGHPWVLEVNTNPCLSPDAGFYAATSEAGLSFPETLQRIIAPITPGATGRSDH